MLTGYERFIRLCIERHVSINEPLEQTFNSAPNSASFGSEKSPKLFGLPKPYTGLKLHGNSSYISPSSYMANRPDYMRRREPGTYSRTSIGTNNSNSPTTPSTSMNTSGGSLGSYGKLPGVAGIMSTDNNKSRSKSATLPGSVTLPEIVSSSEAHRTSDNSADSNAIATLPNENDTSGKVLSNISATVSRSDGHHTPDTTIKELISKLPPVPPPGASKETVTRTTYTETTVKRVTTNQTVAPPPVKPIITEVIFHPKSETMTDIYK